MRAVLVDKKLPSGRLEVLLKKEGPYLNVESQEGQLFYQLTLKTIKLSSGGNNSRLIFVENSDLGEAQLYLENDRQVHGELEAILGSSHEALVNIKKQKFSQNTVLWSILGVFFLIIIGLVVYRGPIFGGIGKQLPFEWEKKLGDKFFAKSPSANQEKVLELLKKQSDRLRFEEDKWNTRFTFHVSSNVEPNAYATLGGHVFINKGLILELENYEQLLGVVAHEMIHVKERHVARSTFQALGLFTLFQLLIGDVSGIAAVLIDQGGPLLNLHYSRNLEEEADAEAVKLLSRNGIDPRGLAESLGILQKRMEKLRAESPASEVLEKLEKIEILSSHPEMKRRIEILKNKIKVATKGLELNKISDDYEVLKSEVKNNF